MGGIEAIYNVVNQVMTNQLYDTPRAVLTQQSATLPASFRMPPDTPSQTAAQEGELGRSRDFHIIDIIHGVYNNYDKYIPCIISMIT